VSRVSQLEEAKKDTAASAVSDEILECKINKIYEQKMEDENFAHTINKYVSFSGLIDNGF